MQRRLSRVSSKRRTPEQWLKRGVATYINNQKVKDFLSHPSAPIAAAAAKLSPSDDAKLDKIGELNKLLGEKLYVRTKNFKDWFGDWEKNPKSVPFVPAGSAGERAGTLFRFAKTPEEFDATQKEAVEKKGIVMDGLNEAMLNVVNVPRHDFTGTGNEAIRKARKWAKENMAGVHVYHQGQEDEFSYKIEKEAIDKFLSSSSTTNSANLGVHLAALKKLPEIIDNSIEAEIHPDYKKISDSRSLDYGVDRDNVLIHRLYGAVEIDGKIYNAKTTIQEFRDKENEAYTYKIIEAKLVISGSTTSDALKSPTSISAANLLKEIEKSYDKGKKLLTESKILTPVNKNTMLCR